MLNYLRLLLFPFSIIYGLAIWLRTKLYNWGWLPSATFNLPIIGVGNLAVGGSGKTPTTEYLVRLLSNYKIAILSRGYGRNTKGFILADSQATAATIGDEPLQYFNKFEGKVTVAVCEDRATGIKQLENDHDLVILDDAFQHRRIKAGLNILLFEFAKLGKFQFLLPAGNLRDLFSARKRADILLVTKAPVPMQPVQQHMGVNELQPYLNQPVLFSYLKYGNLKAVTGPGERSLSGISSAEVYLLTGIANPNPLIEELGKYTDNLKHEAYPDHHSFTRTEIQKFIYTFQASKAAEKIIITTEKDSQRLRATGIQDLLVNLPLYFLPVQVDLFEQDKSTFDQLILNYVKSNRRNR